MADNIQNNHSTNGASGAEPEGREVNWERLYQESQAECERLRLELAETRKQRKECMDALCAMLPPPDLDYTKEELFACLDMKPTLQEVIEELERDPAYDQQR